MSDRLLQYYERELAFIKNESQDFANRYPKIAGRLKLGADELEDPLIERLISSFAFLNSRIQSKLDDDFPELTDAILGTLYPHYQQPIPSMTIAQFDTKHDIKEKTLIEKGAQLQTNTVKGVACEFSTSYDTVIYPLVIEEAELMFRPFVAPSANSLKANAVLHFKLTSSDGKTPISDMELDDLRFFLKGQSHHSQKLYELLFTQVTKLVITQSADDPQPIHYDSSKIKPVGFGVDEGMLPYPDNTFMGYRLLTEFFVFPEKFLFFDLADLRAAVSNNTGTELHFYLYLDDPDSDLEHQISKDNFALGCTPAVNIFKQTTEAIRLNHLHPQYPVIANARHENAYEILSIENVTGITKDGTKIEYRPFFSQTYDSNKRPGTTYWHSSRQQVIEGEHNNELASELNISFVDLNLNFNTPADVVVNIETRCCNRNMPSKLPFTGSMPLFAKSSSVPPVEIHSITAPTPTLRAPLKSGAHWRLISHLNLNHLSLSSSPAAREALKEILRLYDFRDSASTRTTIESIDKLITRTISAPITIDQRSVLCRGTEIEIIFDPMKLGGQSIFLFANVLEVFFGLYCSINSFVRLIAKHKGNDRELKRWPPRAGEHQLL